MQKPKQSKILFYTAAFLGCCFALAYFVFCIYYLSHSRAQLLADYLSNGECFYRQEKFINVNFVNSVKQTGNILCIISMPLVLLLAYYLSKFSSLNIWNALKLHLGKQRSAIPWLFVLVVLCIGMSIYGFYENSLCTDEAFSALNFAQQPLARILSYYPIPNNHVFFNLLNHFAYPFLGNSFVSARILSIVFYCILIVGNFFLLLHFTRNNFVSFLCCVLLSLQFLVWGFGHQGRGYALCYLMEWGSFVAFYYYFFSAGNFKKEALAILFFCNVIGMWTVPVFLYCLFFQAFAAIALMVIQRKLHFAFGKMMMFCGIAIFLCYLPMLCYSGFAAVSGNGYKTDQTITQITQQSADYFYELVSLQTFGFLDGFKEVAVALFLLPIVAFFVFRKLLKPLHGLLLLYVLQWVAIFIMIVGMRQFPLMRGIGFQLQFSLIIFLLLLTNLLLHFEKYRTISITFFALLVMLAAVRMYNYNKEISHYALYGQDTKHFLNELKSLPQNFGSDADIWLSDESFIWSFVLKDLSKVKNYDCNFNNQKVIFLSEDDRPLPQNVMDHYTEKNRAGWFIIYERK